MGNNASPETPNDFPLSETAMRGMISSLAPEDIRTAECLERLAGLLRHQQNQLLEAANLEARAKAIRKKVGPVDATANRSQTVRDQKANLPGRAIIRVIASKIPWNLNYEIVSDSSIKDALGIAAIVGVLITIFAFVYMVTDNSLKPAAYTPTADYSSSYRSTAEQLTRERAADLRNAAIQGDWQKARDMEIQMQYHAQQSGNPELQSQVNRIHEDLYGR